MSEDVMSEQCGFIVIGAGPIDSARCARQEGHEGRHAVQWNEDDAAREVIPCPGCRCYYGCDCVTIARVRVRLMRGQVVVRELDASPSSALWTPDPRARARDVKTHRGLVLALGPPARVTEHPSSAEVPYGFEVGAIVQYHFGAVGTQASRTRAWTDGEPATWLCAAEVDAVWEPDYGPAIAAAFAAVGPA
jgi:hypothetical protein